MQQTQGYGNTQRTYHTNSEATVPDVPVFVTPKEWQQSVASVFDPSGLKRKWDYEQQMAMHNQGPKHRTYGRTG